MISDRMSVIKYIINICRSERTLSIPRAACLRRRRPPAVQNGVTQFPDDPGTAPELINERTPRSAATNRQRVTPKMYVYSLVDLVFYREQGASTVY